MKNKSYILFWGCGPKNKVQKGCFSQWWPCQFNIGGNTFSSAEQYMMYVKAITFGDNDTAEQIMAAYLPKEIKELGRAVSGFDPVIWDKVKFQTVIDGNMAKFSQNRELRDFLIQTGNAVIAEASPKDRIWGIGLAEDDPRAHDSSKWHGKNLLGRAIMEVRARLTGKQRLDEDYILSDNLHNRFWSRSSNRVVISVDGYEITPYNPLFLNLDPERTIWYGKDKHDQICSIIELNGQTRIFNLLSGADFISIGLSPLLEQVFAQAEPYFSYSASTFKVKKGLNNFVPDVTRYALACAAWCIATAQGNKKETTLVKLISKGSKTDVDKVKTEYDNKIKAVGDLGQAIDAMLNDVVNGVVKTSREQGVDARHHYSLVRNNLNYDQIDAMFNSFLILFEAQAEYATHQAALAVVQEYNKAVEERNRGRTSNLEPKRPEEASHIETLQRMLHAILTKNGFSGYYSKEIDRETKTADFDTLVLFDKNSIKEIRWSGDAVDFERSYNLEKQNAGQFDEIYENMLNRIVEASAPAATADLYVSGIVYGLGKDGVTWGEDKKQVVPENRPIKIPRFRYNGGDIVKLAKEQYLEPFLKKLNLGMQVSRMWYEHPLRGKQDVPSNRLIRLSPKYYK